MADRNNKAEEDYLDSLLRSLTGEADNPEDEKKIEEEMDMPEKDFDADIEADIDADGLDEQFLSEFEKEFFDDGETELLENDVMGQEEINKLSDDINEQKNGIEENESEALQEKPEESEEKPEERPEEKPEERTEERPEEKPEEIPDETLFDVDSDILGAIDEAVAESGNDEEKTLVDEAISKEDSSVEDDLKGLYDILGVENNGDELPENVEEMDTETPKKKKGLFSRKDKKDKKEKKSKKEKQDDKSDDSEKTQEESIDIDSLFAEEQNQDIPVMDETGDFGFGLDDSGSGADAGEDQDFGFGLDDSSFDDMDENERLIQQMDDGEIDEDELLEDDDESDKKKKKKDKKEKKEKKEKKKKEKAPKKKKPKKEKKEKKPKEPDEIIHIPIVFLVFALSFVIVAVLAAKFGGDYYYYNQQFYEAISLYVYGNELEEGEVLDQQKYERKFSEAYTLLNGLEMKTKDHQAFFDQLETIMLMDRHYEAYKSYIMMGDYEHGLDSLVKAVKMYDKYQNKARDLKCFDEMTLVLSWVDEKLTSTYGISESQARELHMISDDDEYAVQVRTIAAKARALHGNNTDGEE